MMRKKGGWIVGVLVIAVAAWVLVTRKATSLPTEGLIAYYSFNGNADDASGHARHGSAEGVTLTSDRRGKPGQAYAFEGTAAVEVRPRIFDGIQDAFTVSAWCRPTSKTKSYVFIHAADGRNVRLFWSHEATPLSVSWNIDDAGGETHSITAGPLELGRWCHVAATYDGHRQELYLNGVLATSINWTAHVDWTEGFSYDNIGGGACRWHGDLDEVRFYSRGLSPEEVATLYRHTP